MPSFNCRECCSVSGKLSWLPLVRGTKRFRIWLIGRDQVRSLVSQKAQNSRPLQQQPDLSTRVEVPKKYEYGTQIMRVAPGGHWQSPTMRRSPERLNDVLRDLLANRLKQFKRSRVKHGEEPLAFEAGYKCRKVLIRCFSEAEA